LWDVVWIAMIAALQSHLLLHRGISGKGTTIFEFVLSSLRRCSAPRIVDDKTPGVVRLMPHHVRRLPGQFQGLAVSGDTFQAPTGEDQSHIVSAKNLIDLQLHAAPEPEKPAQDFAYCRMPTHRFTRKWYQRRIRFVE